MIIFKQTIKNYFNLKFLIIYFSIFIPVYLALIFIFTKIKLPFIESYYLQMDKHLAGFFIVSFMWTLGLPFLIMTANRGCSIYHQEIEEDTMIVLISKPITRYHIFIEKWLATMLISISVGVLSLFLSLSLYVVYYRLPSNTIILLLSLIPSLCIYMLFIVFVIIALSIFVTMVLNKRMWSMVIMVVFIMLFEFMIPLFKLLLTSSGVYEKFNLYLVDINYQFGYIQFYIIDKLTNVPFSPYAKATIDQFIGIFNLSNNGEVDLDLGFIPNHFQPLNYINPVIIIIFWLSISIIMMYLSYIFLKRKDIT